MCMRMRMRMKMKNFKKITQLKILTLNNYRGTKRGKKS